MEAIIAAIYVDGGLKCARTSILKVWGRRLDDAPQKSFEAKSFLQEWAQARGMQPPIYQEIQRTGPDHAPVFNIKVFLENGVGASGTASSKRAAEQEAAKNLLRRFSK